MNLNRRNFLFGSAAAATLAGCATNKVGLRPLKPGEPGAVPVDWDGLIPVSEKDGVEWYVVECERHFEDLSAVLPSYNFLRSKGLNA